MHRQHQRLPEPPHATATPTSPPVAFEQTIRRRKFQQLSGEALNKYAKLSLSSTLSSKSYKKLFTPGSNIIDLKELMHNLRVSDLEGLGTLSFEQFKLAMNRTFPVQEGMARDIYHDFTFQQRVKREYRLDIEMFHAIVAFWMCDGNKSKLSEVTSQRNNDAANRDNNSTANKNSVVNNRYDNATAAPKQGVVGVSNNNKPSDIDFGAPATMCFPKPQMGQTLFPNAPYSSATTNKQKNIPGE